MANPADLKTPITVEEIQQEELYGVVAYAQGESAPLDAKAIKRKLRAAEDFYERELGIRFRPTRVFSDLRARAQFPESDLNNPTDFDRTRDLDEPAYDYDPANWNEMRWGITVLRQRPVMQINQWVYAYPGTAPTFRMPLSWIKGDYEFGRFHIVPSGGDAIAIRFNGFVASLSTGNRGIPMSVFIDYVAGFGETEEEAKDVLLADHEDLLEGIRLRTILSLGGVLINTRAGGTTGGSLSQDGLSESRTYGGKYGAYSGMIELAKEQELAARKNWKRQSKGVPCVFA